MDQVALTGKSSTKILFALGVPQTSLKLGGIKSASDSTNLRTQVSGTIQISFLSVSARLCMTL